MCSHSVASRHAISNHSNDVKCARLYSVPLLSFVFADFIESMRVFVVNLSTLNGSGGGGSGNGIYCFCVRFKILPNRKYDWSFVNVYRIINWDGYVFWLSVCVGEYMSQNQCKAHGVCIQSDRWIECWVGGWTNKQSRTHFVQAVQPLASAKTDKHAMPCWIYEIYLLIILTI